MNKFAKLATTVAAAGIAVSLTAMTPAGAAIVDTDRPLINAAHADFGSNLSQHLFGSPTEAGFVTWGDNGGPSDRDSWVKVFGKIYLDEPFVGGCAILRATYRNSAGATLATDSRSACRTGPGLPSFAFSDFDRRDTRIVSIRLCTTYRAPGSAIETEQTCVTRNRGD